MALIRRIRVVWTGVAGSPWYSNFYFSNGVGTPTDMKNEVGTMLTGLGQIVTNPIVATIDTEVPLIDSVTGDIQGVELVPAQSVTMAQAEEPLPFSLQALVRLRTNAFNGGRRIQGRFNVPGLGQGFNQSGIMAPAGVTAVNQYVQPLASSNTVDWVVWSRKTGAIATVDSAACQSKFAILRSRRD